MIAGEAKAGSQYLSMLLGRVYQWMLNNARVYSRNKIWRNFTLTATMLMVELVKWRYRHQGVFIEKCGT